MIFISRQDAKLAKKIILKINLALGVFAPLREENFCFLDYRKGGDFERRTKRKKQFRRITASWHCYGK